MKEISRVTTTLSKEYSQLLYMCNLLLRRRHLAIMFDVVERSKRRNDVPTRDAVYANSTDRVTKSQPSLVSRTGEMGSSITSGP